jgi:hypothetical protein
VDSTLDQLVDFSSEGIYGNGFAYDRFYTFVSGGPGEYPICPSQVPLGDMKLDVLKEISVGSNSYGHEYTMHFGVPSLETLAQDVADSDGITVPTTVTVYDNDGNPQPDHLVDSNSENSGSFFVNGERTDANGQVMFGSPLGEQYTSAQPATTVPLPLTSVFVNGGGIARVSGQPLEIELNGPGVCRFMGTAYDSFNQPLLDYEIFVSIYNGGDRSDFFSVFTDPVDGGASFDAFPGEMYLYGNQGEFGFGEFTIDNCRLENGDPGTDIDPRIIRLDGRFGGFDFLD